MFIATVLFATKLNHIAEYSSNPNNTNLAEDTPYVARDDFW
jgi:hypothetical protein